MEREQERDSKLIYAPFTPEQVESLARWQNTGHVHPYTCGRRSEHGGESVLIPTEAGWVCPDQNCDYTQDWAHEFMVDNSWMDRREENLRASGFLVGKQESQ